MEQGQSEEVMGPFNEGEYYLRMLGRADLVGTVLQTKQGPIQAEDFLDICGDHARGLFSALNNLPEDSPHREVYMGIVNEQMLRMLDL